MAKNTAAIVEGDGGRDMMIQSIYITWTEKDGRLGLMRQWANVWIINDEAFVNPRVDVELLRPIEWSLKGVDEKKDDEPTDEKKTEAEEKEPDVQPSSPKRTREDEEGNRLVRHWSKEELIKTSHRVI